MSETPAQKVQVEGKMFLFEQPELLVKEAHGTLGLDQMEKPFQFAAKVRAVPLTVTEFPAAQKSFPIIYADTENLVPLAVVGLIDDDNLFVGEDGKWEDNAYIPGYLRRYPFAFAGDAQNDRMAVVIDRAAPGLREGGQLPLFNGDKLSEQSERAIEFCKGYERDRRGTEQFTAKLKGLGIVAQQQAQFKPDGADQEKPFAAYVGIDEQKFRELPDDKLIELHKEGMLPFIYAQLMSMGNWRRLLERRARRTGQADPTQVLN
ncbi:MAG: SapC family protein [Pseudomonadota bacterium]